MKIVLLGAPGAGKGTQADLIVKEYGIPHISTGEAFRSNITKGTEIGLFVKSYMEKGLLVPDEVTIEIVSMRLKEDDCKNGFMLDGFPRSIPQAQALDKATSLDAVINIDVSYDVIYKRLTGRRNCSCGAIYHVSTYTSNNCAKCGKELFIRDDDKEEPIKKRLEVYEKITQPLISYYEKKGLLKTIVSSDAISDTFLKVKSILDTLI
ncbi:MAG: adenylate kinase [Christensenellaceae bacterium]|jgi:adenylate kinase|nr:adenylate kinase [Christensenellaceae bacterium]